MTNHKSRCLAAAAIAALTGASLAQAQAQQSYEHVICRAGTMTVLAQADKVVVWALDHRGVYVTTRGVAFDGFTQRCVGVIASIEGKNSGSGYCRSVDPKTGDWTVVDWTAADKPGFGTYAFRYGTGKWKGVTGGGTFEPVGPTRPVDPGTYQNCSRIKGTFSLPG